MSDIATAFPTQQKKILASLLALMCQADCVGGSVLRIVMDPKMFSATRHLLDQDTFAPPGSGREGQIDHVVNKDDEFRLLGIQITREGE